MCIAQASAQSCFCYSRLLRTSVSFFYICTAPAELTALQGLPVALAQCQPQLSSACSKMWGSRGILLFLGYAAIFALQAHCFKYKRKGNVQTVWCLGGWSWDPVPYATGHFAFVLSLLLPFSGQKPSAWSRPSMPRHCCQEILVTEGVPWGLLALK